MSDALTRMVAYLTSPAHHPWKPDRKTAAQIRRCSACESFKAADQFSVSDNWCRACRKLKAREGRKREAKGRWSA